jgi:hypothetical protein
VALNTRNKRTAVMNLGCPWRGLLPIPDGTLDRGDRFQIMFLASMGRSAVTSSMEIVAVYDGTIRLTGEF